MNLLEIRLDVPISDEEKAAIHRHIGTQVDANSWAEEVCHVAILTRVTAMRESSPRRNP